MQLESAVEIVKRGGLLVYPTETLYAIGGDGRNTETAYRVFEFKKRDVAKPLPLIIGDMEQLPLVTDWKDDTLTALARAFWPGPLSILVPARDGLSAFVRDRRGLTSVRVSPHPVAAALSIGAETPLIATSANISGCEATALPHELDERLVKRVDGVLDVEPWPKGGDPSTVVGIESKGRLRVYREGAVSMKMLEEGGFSAFQQNEG